VNRLVGFEVGDCAKQQTFIENVHISPERQMCGLVWWLVGQIQNHVILRQETVYDMCAYEPRPASYEDFHQIIALAVEFRPLGQEFLRYWISAAGKVDIHWMTDATKTNKLRRRPLVVVAGQVPPPTGGQNVMIARILAELGNDPRYSTEYLAFGFTPDLTKVRQPHFSKLLELAKVYGRVLKLLLRRGRADLLIYPSGGPENVPVVRDILLLPAVKVLSKNLWVQFHAAGIADRLKLRKGPLEWLLRLVYRGVSGAIVMTEFNRKDPEALSIPIIKLLPHRLVDLNCEGKLPDFSVRPLRILYAGHLCSEKGIPQLLEAFAGISARHSELRLVLMGECLPPYSSATFEESCRQLGISEKVELTGLLTGEPKIEQFRSAHFFVFPSVAPYESFGLTMVEAMMWGMPLVVSNWRGNREVAGPSAEFFEVGSSMSGSLARALFRLLENPLRWEAVARETREHFNSLYGQKAPQYPEFVAGLLAG